MSCVALPGDPKQEPPEPLEYRTVAVYKSLLQTSNFYVVNPMVNQSISIPNRKIADQKNAAPWKINENHSESVFFHQTYQTSSVT